MKIHTYIRMGAHGGDRRRRAPLVHHSNVSSRPVLKSCQDPLSLNVLVFLLWVTSCAHILVRVRGTPNTSYWGLPIQTSICQRVPLTDTAYKYLSIGLTSAGRKLPTNVCVCVVCVCILCARGLCMYVRVFECVCVHLCLSISSLMFLKLSGLFFHVVSPLRWLHVHIHVVFTIDNAPASALFVSESLATGFPLLFLVSVISISLISSLTSMFLMKGPLKLSQETTRTMRWRADWPSETFELECLSHPAQNSKWQG